MNTKKNKNKNKNKSIKKGTIKKGTIKKGTIKKGTIKKIKREKKVLKDNFYNHVNNQWITSKYISKDMSYKSPFTILQKKVDNQLLKCVKNLIKTNKQCKSLFV